jgi:hypothetical protein
MFHDNYREESHIFCMSVNVIHLHVHLHTSVSPLSSPSLSVTRLRVGRNSVSAVTVPIWAGYCSFLKRGIAVFFFSQSITPVVLWIRTKISN